LDVGALDAVRIAIFSPTRNGGLLAVDSAFEERRGFPVGTLNYVCLLSRGSVLSRKSLREPFVASTTLRRRSISELMIGVAGDVGGPATEQKVVSPLREFAKFVCICTRLK